MKKYEIPEIEIDKVISEDIANGGTTSGTAMGEP